MKYQLNMNIYLFTTLMIILLSSCSNSNPTANVTSAGSVDTTASQTNPPVETSKANTDYKSAFEGQTRISGVKTNMPITATVLTKSLKMPWGIVPLPDGRLLIS